MPTRHSRRPMYVALAVIALVMTGWSLWPSQSISVALDRIANESQRNAPSGSPVELDLGEGGDYYRVVGEAKREHNVAPGQITYCPLDEQARAACAYGELTSLQRDRAQRHGRQEITVDPAGWTGDNNEVDIPALPDVAGSTPYHGWMFNRSHLIADSLGGDATATNLVTGTRTQNVGSTQKQGQYAGGMAHTELLARTYLDTGAGDACPLYYAVTPQYTDTELVPRTVIVDIVSCDKSINERVEVTNAAHGFAINYATGDYRKL